MDIKETQQIALDMVEYVEEKYDLDNNDMFNVIELITKAHLFYMEHIKEEAKDTISVDTKIVN